MELRNVDDVYPLTPMQRLMLVHAASGSAAATAPGLLENQFRYEIHGPINAQHYERAWHAVVARHAALRTAVLWDGLAQPLQVVRTRVSLPFTYVDLASDPPASRQARLEALCAADAAQPHDLSRAPLMRCTLVRLSPDLHHFLWNVHHLVVDRWSHELIFADVAAQYVASTNDTAPELAPAGQFREYVAWLQRQSEDEAEDFWRRELHGFERASLLTPQGSTRQGPRQRTDHELATDQARLLQQRALEWRTTSSAIMLSALAVTLARRTGRADIAFGVTVSGRPPELDLVENTVGSFVGNVPLRTVVEPSRLLGDWVRGIQAGQVARQPFEHVSPATIREAAPQLPAAEPLFDLLAVLNQEAPAPRPADPLSFVMRAAGATFDAAYPLVLGVLTGESAVKFTLVHDAAFSDARELLSELDRAVRELLEGSSDSVLSDIVHGLPFPSTESHSVVLPAPSAQPATGDDTTDMIRGIWCEVLGRADVGLDDDLFEIGGSSLQATRIFALVERRVGVRVPLSVLLEARSIRGLATTLGTAARSRTTHGAGDNGNYGNRLETEPISRAGSEPAPLSFAQERLWILDQLDGASAVYNMAETFRLRGPLVADDLESALEQLVRRQEVLRAAYPEQGGEAVQVDAGLRLDWASEDLRRSADPEALHARIQQVAWQPFRLATGPLFRARLFRVGDEEHVLLLVMHHSVSDAWSVGRIKLELGVLYNVIVRGSTDVLPELPFQYRDFARWQRVQLRGERLAALVSYWREALADVAPLDLPTDRPRPPVQTFRGGIRRASLDPTLVRRLQKLAREESVTLNMTLTAAFHVLLARYSAQSDIVVGTPFAGRTRVDTEALVGMFVNTLAIRSDCSGDRTFRELLRDIRTRSLEAHGRQELPFEKLVAELQPVRDLSRNPIVQVLFSLQDTPDHALTLDGVEVTDELLDHHTAKFDLSLYLREPRMQAGRELDRGSSPDPAGLDAVWEFASDLFDPDTIDRMHGHFETLLASVAADPAQRIGDLPLMRAQEQHDLLVAWNGTAVARASIPSVQHFVEVQAEQIPDAPAVRDATCSLSYSELDARANRLAHHLIAGGLQPKDLAAIRLGRSVDQVVAVLAILKAGAAFLPLDPTLPRERAAYMLNVADVSLVVTTADLLPSLPVEGVQSVCLDREAAGIDGRPSARPAVLVDPRDLAYVIFTSGSTGRPKGVEVTHANLIHFLQGMIDRPGLGTHDALLSIATLSFDIAMLELLGPLTVGGRVFIAGAAEVTSGEALRESLESGDFTILQATPATWQMLIDAGWTGTARLRALVGAEALSPALARQLHERCAEVWNLYGPTETTVWSTCSQVPPDAQAIQIGRPIGNTRMYVLDARMQPVPRGIPGELYIGGLGVTRGYRNRPELTAERFLPDPFAADPEARLYRTGDRVRVASNDELEYLGRTDRQVKIRGFRIELGEIEAVLMEHEGVRQSLVIGREMGTLDARLVAYVVLESGASVTPSELRRHLRTRLPDYMVPGFVIELDAFPRTFSGKVDWNALPDPLSSTLRAASEHAPPVTTTEMLIARVWSGLLERERISRHDNFYELGGHSLLGLKAAAAIRHETGTALNPRAMFFQTLEQLAAQLDLNES